MIVDLHDGEYWEVEEFCCEDMKIQMRVGNVVDDSVNLMIPDYRGDGKRGGLDIDFCPFCGAKIYIINPYPYQSHYNKVKKFFEKNKLGYYPSQISELLEIDYETLWKILRQLEDESIVSEIDKEVFSKN